MLSMNTAQLMLNDRINSSIAQRLMMKSSSMKITTSYVFFLERIGLTHSTDTLAQKSCYFLNLTLA